VATDDELDELWYAARDRSTYHDTIGQVRDARRALYEAGQRNPIHWEQWGGWLETGGRKYVVDYDPDDDTFRLYPMHDRITGGGQ